MSRFPRITGLLTLCLALVWPGVAVAQVYKIVGPDGKISYSDTPPASKQAPTARALPGMVAGAAASGAVPKLQPGLWEFRRSFVIDGTRKDITTQNCTDPISTMSFWKKATAKVGCTYEDTRRSGNRYTQASACKIDALAMDRRYTSTLEVNGEEAYVLEESATGGNQPPMSSVTQARRLSGC